MSTSETKGYFEDSFPVKDVVSSVKTVKGGSNVANVFVVSYWTNNRARDYCIQIGSTIDDFPLRSTEA